MPYVTPIQNASHINFLAAAEFTAFTVLVPQSLGVVQPNGKRIVPAGTVFPANDATAQGILLTATDVTYGAQPGSLMVEGYVLESRLPAVVATAAKTALKEIKFPTAAL